MAPKSAKAAAPAPATAEVEEFTIEVGTQVQFLGYGPDVPESDRLIDEGAILEVTAIGAEDDPEAIFVTIPNPDFNPKKKENAETNPKMIEVNVLDTEIGPVEEVAGDEVEQAEAEAAPAPAVKGKATTKAAAKAAAEAPAPVAAKGKAATKTAAKSAPAAEEAAPAKGKGKGKAAAATDLKSAKKSAAKKVAEKVAEAEEQVDPDALPDLEQEDETVATMVAEREGELTLLAQELEQQAATSEYQLGGVLYHLKKSGEYLEMDDGAYNVDGGWQEFLATYFNVQYRKAQYLIEMYVAFSQRNIENAAEVVAAMGWSKASKIAKPLLQGYDADELIEAANNNTVEDLSTVVKEMVSEGGTRGTAGEKVAKLTIKFRLVNDDAVTAQGILAQAQEQLGVKDVGDAFMQILIDWANDHGVAVGAEEEQAAQAAPAPRKTAGKRAQTA